MLAPEDKPWVDSPKDFQSFGAAVYYFIPTISVLDQHATIISNRQYTTTQNLHDCFQNFILALDKQGYTGHYLDGPQEPKEQYWLFWKAVKVDVKKIT
jgi:hypothetical protein